MRNISIIFIFSVIGLISCSENKTPNYSKEDLQGDWVEIRNDNYINGPGYSGDFGLGFQGDTIEFKLGFWPNNDGEMPGKAYYFTQYELRQDSIFIHNPKSNEFEFFYNIQSISSDTLTFVFDDSISFQMKKMKYENQSFTNFDQIVFSSPGCYGNCLAYSISLKSDGSVLFHGNTNVDNIGFFKTQVDMAFTKVIFRKYYNGNIENLETNYSNMSSHSQSMFTTLIKDGKILKTIRTTNSFGRIGPNELLWANIPVEKLLYTVEYDSISQNQYKYSIIESSTFFNDSGAFNLEHSEAFYLWTKLINSRIVDSDFERTYKLRVSDEFYYSNEKMEANIFNYNIGIKEVNTDGRFYEFNFKSKKSIVYDIGYNFMDVNFSANDFEKFED